MSGELAEGQLYSETKITALLGMSRTPVRDALIRLNMEGLIETFPSRGFSVKKVSTVEIRETLEIRCALEGYAAYVLAEQIDTPKARETMFWLNECIAEQERLLLSPKPNITKFVDQNFYFHNIMVDFLGNEAITRTYKRYEGSIKELTYRRFLGVPESMRESFKGHIQILALIRSGNTEQVFTRIKSHNDEARYVNM